MIEIKVINEPKQKFSLLLNNRRVTFELWYNSALDRWMFDVSIDGAPVLAGRKIVTGIDLIKPFNFGIGAIFAMVETQGGEANRNGLPNGLVRLYHATKEEVDAAMAS